VPAGQPQLNVYQLEYQQQMASNKVIAKKYLPKLSLQGAAWARGSSIAPNDAYGPLNDGMGYQRYNYLVGIAATYNITDLRQRHDQLEEGKYRADARKAAVQNEQANLNTLLLQANNMYTNDLLQLRTLPVLLRSATDAYEQQLVLYKAGLNTLVEVTNALFGLQKAETELVLTQSELLQVQYLRACLSDQQGVFLETFK
jgi:outer membrane protein TolC